MARTENLYDYLEDVATAIKNKKGDQSLIKASEFDVEIENLPSGGGDISEYLTTTIRSGTNASAGYINSIKKLLPYDEVVTSSLEYAFNRYVGEELSFNNLDTSKVTQMNYMFGYASNLKKINGLESFNTANVEKFDYIFYNCQNLENLNINNFDMGKAKSIGGFVTSCSNLTNLIFGFDLGRGYLTTQSENYSFYTLELQSNNKLTKESLLDVINKVYDIASIDVRPQTIKLGATNLAKLTEEEIAIATEKGWNVTA